MTSKTGGLSEVTWRLCRGICFRVGGASGRLTLLAGSKVWQWRRVEGLRTGKALRCIGVSRVRLEGYVMVVTREVRCTQFH